MPRFIVHSFSDRSQALQQSAEMSPTLSDEVVDWYKQIESLLAETIGVTFAPYLQKRNLPLNLRGA